jgi:hypothetical protein
MDFSLERAVRPLFFITCGQRKYGSRSIFSVEEFGHPCSIRNELHYIWVLFPSQIADKTY